MSAQSLAVASQKLTVPWVTWVDDASTVAVRVSIVPCVTEEVADPLAVTERVVVVDVVVACALYEKKSKVNTTVACLATNR